MRLKEETIVTTIVLFSSRPTVSSSSAVKQSFKRFSSLGRAGRGEKVQGVCLLVLKCAGDGDDDGDRERLLVGGGRKRERERNRKREERCQRVL